MIRNGLDYVLLHPRIVGTNEKTDYIFASLDRTRNGVDRAQFEFNLGQDGIYVVIILLA